MLENQKTEWTRTGKTMPFLAFTQSSFNHALASVQFVFPSDHANVSKVNGIVKKIRKRTNPKKFKPEERMRNAEKWLRQSHVKINDLITAYCKRYNLSSTDAHYELMELGYRDELAIQAYEKEGIEWEYMHDGYSGLDLVVPKGNKDWELS